jgi:hypothetical protein
MSETPPPPLIALLDRLGLAGPAQIRKAEKHVGRLARELPRFESVWIDALAQSRVLSPFQAAELNAGRGPSLRVGPYLLCHKLGDCPWIDGYRARRIESGETVRLAVAVPRVQADAMLSRLERLVAASRSLPAEHVLPIVQVGNEGGRLWAASRWVEGRTAAQWMVHNGRFPPPLVLEIAREMLAGLAILEKHSLCHGDVGAQSLLLTARGEILLLQPGLRAILRPEEGYAHADLQPEAYDYLAPERVAAGTPPDLRSDLFACGCLWWHLLCGRPPLTGGEGLAKLRAAHAAAIIDVRRLAPDVPRVLADAIATCVQRDPRQRPESMAALAALLGPPAGTARRALARCMGNCPTPAARWAAAGTTEGSSGRGSRWLAAAALGLIACVAVLWPLWRRPRGVHPLPAAQATKSPPLQTVAPLTTAGNRAAADSAADGPADLLLAAEKPLKLDSLPLRTGQCVRGALGKRPLVLVPVGGLLVSAEKVRFENIDFLWKHAGTGVAAIIQLRTGHAQFHGCTFQAATGTPAPPAAIAWTHPADRARAALSLPSGHLGLSDCLFHGVATAIDCHTLGALRVDISNTLFLGNGPVLRLDHCPKLDEPLTLGLARVTLRGTGPLLHCGHGEGDRVAKDSPAAGEIAVQADACVFAPAGGQAILLLEGPAAPERVLQAVRWTGQGALVLPETAMVAYRGPDGRQRVLDDASVSMAGLVRSAVDFADRAENGPAASRVLRWQAPLQSADPPGADVDSLPHGEFDKPER